MRFITYALLGLGLLIPSVQARPVSYPGGWTLITEHDGETASILLHYSLTAYISLGYRIEYLQEGDFSINAIQLNALLKRWNTKDSQANIYLKSGLGVAGKTEAAGFTGISFDWESRRLFASYKFRYLEAGDIGSMFLQSARFGGAPYVGDFGDLHTWLMLEIKHTPRLKNEMSVIPLVRIFKNVHLFEIGVSNHKDILANYTYRY